MARAYIVAMRTSTLRASSFLTAIAARLVPAVLVASAVACGGSGASPDGASQEADVTSIGQEYERKSAAEKQAILWENATSDEYCKSAGGAAPYDVRALEEWGAPEDDRAFYSPVKLPGELAEATPAGGYLTSACEGALATAAAPAKSTKERVVALLSQSKAFDHNSDEIDSPRFKIIHVFGSAAAVVFQTVDGEARVGFGVERQRNPYTGLLGSRQQIPGILRIGEAGVPLGDPIMGLALKLFVDGQASRNIHGMTRINGQPNGREPFALPITNMLQFNEGTNIGVVGVLKALQLVKPDSLQVPIDHFARVRPDGRDLVEGVSFPHEVSFSPEPRVARVVHKLLADNPTMDVRQALAAIPVGTVLYRVQARRNGPGGTCNDFAEIGRIVLASPLVASGYEDRTLFFRHNRGKWRPEGNRQVPWVAGQPEVGAKDVNEENRNAVFQDCTN